MKSILTATLFSLAMATAAFAQSSDNGNNATNGNPVVNGPGSSTHDGQTTLPVDPNSTNSTDQSAGSNGKKADPCSDANPVKSKTMTQDENCAK